MRKVKVSEVANLDPKENIPSIQGTFSKAWDYKTGDGEDGAWSFQTASIKDDTGEIKVVLKNQDNIKGMLHREVLISSHSGPRGLSGIYIDDNEYPKNSGKVARQIKVTATAEIILVDGSQKAPEGSSARPDKQGASGQPTGSMGAFKHSLMRVLNAFYAIERAVAIEVEQSKVSGFESTPEHIQAKCSTAFITLDRQGLVQGLPDKPLWGAEKQLEEKPEPDEESW